MNFKQWLTEMPITTFQTIGKWNKPGQGFNAQDVGILTNPAAVEKIHKRWSNTEENFDFYFVKQPGAAKFQQVGEVTPEWVKQNLGLDIQPNPDNITVIFTNNKGGEKMPMTAWLIAHRMGHAMSNTSYWENFTNELQRDFIRILREAYHYEYGANYGENRAMDQNALLALAYEVCTMRSARQRNLLRFYELNYEMLAQRLLSGKVKFNKLPRCITPDPKKAWGRSTGRAYCGNPEELAEWDEVLGNYADQYNYLLDAVVQSNVGKIFVM